MKKNHPFRDNQSKAKQSQFQAKPMSKWARFFGLKELGPARCSSSQPFSILPSNETLGPGRRFSGSIDDVKLDGRAVTPWMGLNSGNSQHGRPAREDLKVEGRREKADDRRPRAGRRFSGSSFVFISCSRGGKIGSANGIPGSEHPRRTGGI